MSMSSLAHRVVLSLAAPLVSGAVVMFSPSAAHAAGAAATVDWGAMTIDLVGTSNLFQKGHRIRVDVTSSHFPQFDRNPNTGETFGTSAKVRVANQTVYASKTYPSHIVLPVIPER